MKITKKISSILDRKYYLDYDPEGSALSDKDIEWLFHQIYRKGYMDAVNKIDNAVRKVENQVDKKL